MFRSQIAEAIYNRLAIDGSVSESYGTNVSARNGEGTVLSSCSVLDLELEFMKNKGMDISNNICKQITPELLKDNSKIIMMSEPEFIPEWIKSYPYEYWEIPNPEVHTPEILENVYNLLYKKITEQLINIKND